MEVKNAHCPTLVPGLIPPPSICFYIQLTQHRSRSYLVQCSFSQAQSRSLTLHKPLVGADDSPTFPSPQLMSWRPDILRVEERQKQKRQREKRSVR